MKLERLRYRIDLKNRIRCLVGKHEWSLKRDDLTGRKWEKCWHCPKTRKWQNGWYYPLHRTGCTDMHNDWYIFTVLDIMIEEYRKWYMELLKHDHEDSYEDIAKLLSAGDTIRSRVIMRLRNEFYCPELIETIEKCR